MDRHGRHGWQLMHAGDVFKRWCELPDSLQHDVAASALLSQKVPASLICGGAPLAPVSNDSVAMRAACPGLRAGINHAATGLTAVLQAPVNKNEQPQLGLSRFLELKRLDVQVPNAVSLQIEDSPHGLEELRVTSPMHSSPAQLYLPPATMPMGSLRILELHRMPIQQFDCTSFPMLQRLVLNCWRLERLQNLGTCKELRHLDMTGCCLKELEEGVLKQLTKLEHLEMCRQPVHNDLLLPFRFAASP